MVADEFASPLTNLINLSVERSCFCSDLRKSEPSSLYKCKDSLVSGYYRPLSTLPSVKKACFIGHIICISEEISVWTRSNKIDGGQQTGARQSHACRAFTARFEQSLRLFTTQVTDMQIACLWCITWILLIRALLIKGSITEGQNISS